MNNLSDTKLSLFLNFEINKYKKKSFYDSECLFFSQLILGSFLYYTMNSLSLQKLSKDRFLYLIVYSYLILFLKMYLYICKKNSNRLTENYFQIQ